VVRRYGLNLAKRGKMFEFWQSYDEFEHFLQILQSGAWVQSLVLAGFMRLWNLRGWP